MRTTIWITNGKGENFYVDKDDATKRHPLPGFSLLDDLCMFVTEQGLAEQESEEKVIKLYNFEEKKELPTPVQVLTSLIGGKVKMAVLRQIVDVNAKGDDNKYHPTGKTRTENQVDKIMHPDTGRTINEYKQEIEETIFHDAWLTRNKGKDRLKAKGASGAAAGPGASGEGSPKTPARKSLFGS